jgi:hypothetical protein
VAAETRSPLVETSASASSTRRKSDMTDTLPESPRETERRSVEVARFPTMWTKCECVGAV